MGVNLKLKDTQLVNVDVAAIDILEVVGRDVPLKYKATSWGGEYAGPCPFCGGHDRFLVWPHHPDGRGRWMCRGCESETTRDVIDYVRKRDNCTFQGAAETLGCVTGERATSAPPPAPVAPIPARLVAPGPEWQARARAFETACQAALWDERYPWGLDWLHSRRLTDDTIRAAGLGLNPRTCWDRREAWGLPPMTNDKGKPKGVWLPRGIIIPWEIEGQLWRVNIRRPNGDLRDENDPKYIGPAGSSNGLYNADALEPDRPVVLVEGELDALTVMQHAGDLVSAAATGSTGGSRRVQWIAWLALGSVALVAFDSDEAGEKGAQYWLKALPKARRWQPYWGDVNQMAQDGANVRAWVAAALTAPQPEPEQEAEDWEQITLYLPADSTLPTIAGRWSRLPDGRIRATYVGDELGWAMAAITGKFTPRTEVLA